MGEQRKETENDDRAKKLDYDAEDYPSSSRHAHDASRAPYGEAGRRLTGEDFAEQSALSGDYRNRELGSEPLVDTDGKLVDSRLPSNEDWDYRPSSESEWFAAPDTERAFARNFLRAEPNYPALTGIVLAVFGFAAGLFGFLAALLGFFFSATGIWSARHGARRGYLAAIGIVVSVVYLAGHIARAT